MKEPTVRWPRKGFLNYVPFSSAPLELLKGVVALGQTNNDLKDEWFDVDFRRRYAAILLRERGL